MALATDRETPLGASGSPSKEKEEFVMGSYTNLKTVNILFKKGPLICVNPTDSVELFDLIEGQFQAISY